MEWKAPPTTPRLADGDVHVWRAWLALDGGRLAHAWTLLGPEERRRADRMRFPVHRSRFVAARAALRILLGRYLRTTPSEVPLIREPGGRPALAPSANRSLGFSVSHAGPLALYAFAADRAVGVDVERLRREMPFEQLAARFFTPLEVDALTTLPGVAVPSAFFACWTRKEALFKAWGGASGLVPALKRFAVSVGPDESRIAVRFFGDGAQTARWSLASLDPGPGYTAALAVEGPAAAACFAFHWPA